MGSDVFKVFGFKCGFGIECTRSRHLCHGSLQRRYVYISVCTMDYVDLLYTYRYLWHIYSLIRLGAYILQMTQTRVVSVVG